MLLRAAASRRAASSTANIVVVEKVLMAKSARKRKKSVWVVRGRKKLSEAKAHKWFLLQAVSVFCLFEPKKNGLKCVHFG